MGRRWKIKKIIDGWNGKTSKAERLGGWKWKIKVFATYWLGNWETETLKNCIPRSWETKIEEMVGWNWWQRKKKKTSARTVWAWTLKNKRSRKGKSGEKIINGKID